MEKQGWKITPAMKLPNDYELREDGHFVFLYCLDECVATFTAIVEVIEIKKAVLRNERKRDGCFSCPNFVEG